MFQAQSHPVFFARTHLPLHSVHTKVRLFLGGRHITLSGGCIIFKGRKHYRNYTCYSLPPLSLARYPTPPDPSQRCPIRCDLCVIGMVITQSTDCNLTAVTIEWIGVVFFSSLFLHQPSVSCLPGSLFRG